MPQPPAEAEDQAGGNRSVASEESWQQEAAPAQLLTETIADDKKQKRQEKRGNRQRKRSRPYEGPRLTKQHGNTGGYQREPQWSNEDNQVPPPPDPPEH